MGLFVGFSLHGQTYLSTKLELFQEKKKVIVRDVEIDAKGFIWYIANGNVFRYDGYRSLNVINSMDPDKRFQDFPKYILAGDDGRLWIVGKNSLGYLDLKTWRWHPIPENELPPKNKRNVLWIREAPNGAVLVGYLDGYVLLWNNGVVVLNDRLFQKGNQIGKNIIPRSCAFWKGKAWIGTSSGTLLALSMKGGASARYYELPEIDESIDFIVAQKKQLLLDVFRTGIFRFDGKTTKVHFKNKKNALAFSKRHLFREGQFFHAASKNGNLLLLQSESLRSISNIRIGQVDIFDFQIMGKEVVLATSNGIYMVHEKNQGISSFIPWEQNTETSARGLFRFADGAIFYGGYGGAGYIDMNGKNHSFPNKKNVYAILPLDRFRLLLGMEGDFLQIFDRRDLSFQNMDYSFKKEKYTDPFPKYVISLAENKNSFFIGSKKGLWLLGKKTNELKPFRDKTGDNPTFNLVIRHITTKNGQVLLSTNRGLFRYKNGICQKFFPIGKNGGINKHIFQNDTLWLATQAKGIVAIGENGKILKQITKEDGLSNNLVYSLEVIGNQKIVGTANGLNIIKNGKINVLTKKKGLLQYEFNRGASFYCKTTHKLYMGGLKGYTILDMQENWFPNHAPPQRYISEVHIASNNAPGIILDYTYPYDPDPKITLKPSQGYLTLFFGNPKSYKSDQGPQYRLNTSEQWQELSSGKPISLMGLSPGTYEFSVRVSNALKTTGLHVNIEKLPFFYQTMAFKAAAFLVLVLLFWTWHRNRLLKIKREASLRTKISSDLHDEVGSLLTGISMQAEFLQISKERLSKNGHIETIARSSKEAVQAMSDIVWSIDSRNDSWKSLLVKLREYAYQISEPKGIEFIMEEVGRPPIGFSQTERQAVYLIVKEALNNACKHSKATTIVLSFLFFPGKFQIKIKDNGMGIPKGEFSGQGIRNMKTRAERIHADFRLSSSEKGTVLVLSKHMRKTTRSR